MRRFAVTGPATFQELKKACKEYQRSENPTYRVAVNFIEKSWTNPQDVADGIAVLLLIWNKAFYNRFGSPDYRGLTSTLEKNHRVIAEFRTRSILSYRSDSDGPCVSGLFRSMLKPLSATSQRRAGVVRKARKTPVGVVKALHLLAPRFLPLWDDRIAKRYGCSWSKARPAETAYLEFVDKIQKVCEQVIRDYARTNSIPMRTAIERMEKKIEEECSPSNCKCSLIKLIDEYNFVKYVKPLMRRRRS